MFAKKIWIPIVFVLIVVAIGGTLWGHHIASQEPTKVYKAVEVEELESTDTTPTSQGGHFHADGTWHADAHPPAKQGDVSPMISGGTWREGVWYPENYTQADIEADLAGRGAEPGEEYHRRAYKFAVNIYIQKHRKAYPDCTEYQAIIDDAKRYATWRSRRSRLPR